MMDWGIVCNIVLRVGTSMRHGFSTLIISWWCRLLEYIISSKKMNTKQKRSYELYYVGREIIFVCQCHICNETLLNDPIMFQKKKKNCYVLEITWGRSELEEVEKLEDWLRINLGLRHCVQLFEQLTKIWNIKSKIIIICIASMLHYIF